MDDQLPTDRTNPATRETGFTHVIRGRGMRAFYSRLEFVDPNATLWTSWIMSVGSSSLEPLFIRSFIYRHTDDRTGVAEALADMKREFKRFVVGYYEMDIKQLH